MNDLVGATAKSPTCLPKSPTSHRKSPSLASTRHGTKQETKQGEASGVIQPDTATHRPKSPPSVTDQSVAQPQSHQEGALESSTSTPNRIDTRRVTSTSSRQATVESAEPSPLMTPTRPVDHQIKTLADGNVTPLMTPVGTPVDQRPTTPAEVDPTRWWTPRETVEEEQSNSAEAEWSLDFQALPVLQVVPPLNIDQQEPYEGPIPSMGRWWWPGNHFITSSSFLKQKNTHTE